MLLRLNDKDLYAIGVSLHIARYVVVVCGPDGAEVARTELRGNRLDDPMAILKQISAPGYNSILPNTCSPLARTLKLNGYSTAQFGKCHEVPVWQTSPMGPFDAWPSGGGGFEYFYGFIGGETNQWHSALYEGTTPVEPDKTPEEGYHLTEDMTTKAIKWIRQQKALMPNRPTSSYFAPVQHTRRITSRRNGPTGTPGSSPRGGTCSEKKLRATKAAGRHPA